MKHEAPSVQRLNDMLRRELGSSPSGQALYQWRYTGELMDVFAITDRDGKPIRRPYRTSAGLIVMRTMAERRLQRPDLRNHWAICYWEAPVTEDEWAKLYGTLEDYPSNGTYMVSQTIHREGVAPTQKTTQQHIDAVRKIRRTTVAQRVEASQQEEMAAEKAGNQLIEDFAIDLVPAFANMTPGKRGGSVSFGGTEKLDAKTANLSAA